MREITVIAAVSRADRVAALLNSFARQTYSPRAMLLVLNGPAQHAALPELLPDNVGALRIDGGNPARARNAGLAHVRGTDCPLVSFWDDDDCYRPGYLSEVVGAIGEHEGAVSGKFVRWVLFDDGLYLLQGKQDTFLGGTISGWARHLPDIPDMPRDEDRQWCLRLAAAGARMVPLSARHYIYDRRGSSHAWVATRLQAVAAFGPALRFDIPADIDDPGDVDLSAGALAPVPSLDELGAELLARLASRPFGLSPQEVPE